MKFSLREFPWNWVNVGACATNRLPMWWKIHGKNFREFLFSTKKKNSKENFLWPWKISEDSPPRLDSTVAWWCVKVSCFIGIFPHENPENSENLPKIWKKKKNPVCGKSKKSRWCCVPKIPGKCLRESGENLGHFCVFDVNFAWRCVLWANGESAKGKTLSNSSQGRTHTVTGMWTNTCGMMCANVSSHTHQCNCLCHGWFWKHWQKSQNNKTTKKI